MKGRLLVFIGLAVIVIVVIISIVSRSTAPQSSTPAGIQSPATQEQTVPTTSSRYLAYSQTAFDAAKNQKRVLYFHADWCSTCRPLDKEFSAKVSEIPQDVVLLKLNYDTATELKKKYGITYQHTFVQVDANGNKVTAWSGGGLAELIANTQ